MQFTEERRQDIRELHNIYLNWGLKAPARGGVGMQYWDGKRNWFIGREYPAALGKVDRFFTALGQKAAGRHSSCARLNREITTYLKIVGAKGIKREASGVTGFITYLSMLKPRHHSESEKRALELARCKSLNAKNLFPQIAKKIYYKK